jgi:hypothetical protein
MNVVSRKDQRALHAIRVRERRLRKKLLRELSETIKQSNREAMFMDSNTARTGDIGRCTS